MELIVVSCQCQSELSRRELLHGFLFEGLVKVSWCYGCLVDQAAADLGLNNFSDPFRWTDLGDQAFVCLKVVRCVDIDILVGKR